MRITHLGHACVLIETDVARVLIDPGSFSSFDDVEDLDAIAVTHQHADHVDADRFAALRAANPAARLILEPEASGVLETSDAAFAAGSTTTVGDLEVEGVGGTHAFNHDAVPTVGNVGLVLRQRGGPSVFHPGDSYAETPEGIDVLFLALNAPWTAVRDTLDFVRSVGPGVAIPVHDALLSSIGRDGYLMHVRNFGHPGADVRDLEGSASTEI